MAEEPKVARSPGLRASSYRNAVLNVFWSVLCIAPIFTYCYRSLPKPWIYGSAALSLAAYLVPAAGLRRLQLSSSTRIYRSLGVPLLIRFTQDGGAVRSMVKAEHAQAPWFRDRVVLQKIVRVTYGRERFHLALLLFYLFVAGYAAIHGQVLWTLLLCVSNVIYNLYPVWLQQYIRLRLLRFAARVEATERLSRAQRNRTVPSV